MLQLVDVRKRFGHVQALDGLSLHIRKGEVFGLLGPNGAGKTTAISIAVGLLVPDEGRALVATGAGVPDSPPTRPEVRRRIGVAPQALAVYDELTGLENVRFFGSLYGLRGAALQAAAEKALKLTGLTERRHDRAKGYSGGMKRRLNLAAAIMHDPAVILLDEPTAGVDPQSRNAIFDLVMSLKRSGCTIVYSTHYMEEAERMCDRVAILDHGKLLALDTVPALLNRFGGESVVTIVRGVGEEVVRTADPVGALRLAIEHAGERGAVQSARIAAPSLESAFLTLTGRSLRD